MYSMHSCFLLNPGCVAYLLINTCFAESAYEYFMNTMADTVNVRPKQYGFICTLLPEKYEQFLENPQWSAVSRNTLYVLILYWVASTCTTAVRKH